MIYNGPEIRNRLTTLRDALMAAKDRTELDPFDEAMFTAIHYMLELSDTHSLAVEATLKAIRKLERKSR